MSDPFRISRFRDPHGPLVDGALSEVPQAILDGHRNIQARQVQAVAVRLGVVQNRARPVSTPGLPENITVHAGNPRAGFWKENTAMDNTNKRAIARPDACWIATRADIETISTGYDMPEDFRGYCREHGMGVP
jgi:hypothetical protein